MKKQVIANWKENFTIEQSLNWLDKFLTFFKQGTDFSSVMICASFPLLYSIRKYLVDAEINLRLGAQDVSRFEKGAYTGEVSVLQLKGLVDGIIIGHSERRRYFGEEVSSLYPKVRGASINGFLPLVFLESSEFLLKIFPDRSYPDGLFLVYEPPTAISQSGLGNALSVEDVIKACEELNGETGGRFPIIYGGSVNAENAENYLSQKEVDGVIVGQASLDPETFSNIVKMSFKYDFKP